MGVDGLSGCQTVSGFAGPKDGPSQAAALPSASSDDTPEGATRSA